MSKQVFWCVYLSKIRSSDTQFITSWLDSELVFLKQNIDCFYTYYPWKTKFKALCSTQVNGASGNVDKIG